MNSNILIHPSCCPIGIQPCQLLFQELHYFIWTYTSKYDYINLSYLTYCTYWSQLRLIGKYLQKKVNKISFLSGNLTLQQTCGSFVSSGLWLWINLGISSKAATTWTNKPCEIYLDWNYDEFKVKTGPKLKPSRWLWSPIGWQLTSLTPQQHTGKLRCKKRNTLGDSLRVRCWTPL